MRAVHDRMPVILAPDDWAVWLEGDDPEALLRPAPDDLLRFWPVSKAVNTPRNNGPELLAERATALGGGDGPTPAWDCWGVGPGPGRVGPIRERCCGRWRNERRGHGEPLDFGPTEPPVPCRHRSMPTFHVRIRDGGHLFEDLDGSDPPGLEAARAEALAAARDAVAERLRTGKAVGMPKLARVGPGIWRS